MLTVYRVRVATTKFQYFETDEAEFLESLWLSIHGTEIGADWIAPSVYIFKPKKREGHFVGFLGGRVFAITQEVIDASPSLRSFFEQSGELLPFTYNKREFYVFNCLNCIEALDAKNAQMSATGTTVDSYSFVPTRFQFTLFAIPQSNELLCVEGMSAPADEFKGYVEQQKLTGLMFEKLWSEGE